MVGVGGLGSGVCVSRFRFRGEGLGDMLHVLFQLWFV